MASAAQRRIKKVSYAKYGYLFILPFFIVYFIFTFWPLIQTFILSFYGNGTLAKAGYNAGFTKDDFVGLNNFKIILTNAKESDYDSKTLLKFHTTMHEEFTRSLKNTVILWVGNFIPQLALSLSLAVWFTDAKLRIPGKGFFKVVMYLPNVITAASVAVMFYQILSDGNRPGALNSFLLQHNIIDEKILFITGEWGGRASIWFIQTWMWFGNTMIMLMSGILGINPSLFEAASIDGASSGQTFRKITLPLLTPIMSYTLITSMIGGLQMFDIPFLLKSKTSPYEQEKHLTTVAVFIYKNYFRNVGDAENRNYGISGAASVTLFIITLCLGLIGLYISRDKDAIAKKKQIKKNAKQAKLKDKQFGGFSI